MQLKEAQDLAGRIRSESVETKVGQVNGEYIVHVIVTVPRDDDEKGSTRKSYNIASEAEWNLAEWRTVNQRTPRAKRERLEALANQADIAAALATIYEP